MDNNNNDNGIAQLIKSLKENAIQDKEYSVILYHPEDATDEEIRNREVSWVERFKTGDDDLNIKIEPKLIK